MDGAATRPASPIHAPLPHDSAFKHVAGTAVYADDVPEPRDMLNGYLLLSPVACGTVAPLDLAKARAVAGVAGVYTADDVPGENDTGPVVHDEPMLAGSETAHGEILFAGLPIALIAAETLAAARAAARLIDLDIVEAKPVLTIDDALAAGSYLSEPYRMARGDAAAAIADAPHRLDGRIEIGGQEQFYLEGQIALALPGEDDEMHIVSSNQHPSECQIVVARILGVPAHAVTVEVRRLGGGFGGKETQGNLMAACAALIARATGRPAKLRMDRDQDMVVTGKRHEFRIAYQVGFDSDGRILGLRAEQFARCGWSTDLSNAIADRAMFHADNCYYLPAAEIISHRLRTNTVSNTAFRGFGGPQGMVGAERIIDHIAHHLGKDPVEVRRANFYEAADGPGDRVTTPYHMDVEDCVIQGIVDELIETSDYAARRARIEAWNRVNPILKKGVALIPVKFGISFTTTFLNQAGALVHIYQDGSVMLNHGGVEMGQGLYQKVAQVAASEFGLPLEAIKITATRTDKVPNTSATAASSGADLNGMAVADACGKLKLRLAEFLATEWQVPAETVSFVDGHACAGARAMPFADLARAAYLARTPLSATGFYATPKIHWDREAAKGRPFLYFAYGAAVSEVAIDTLTGESRLLRVDILHDVGKSLNPAIDLGQVEGGFIQGAGWLMMEDLVWDEAGRLRTHAPSTYKIPTASDRPPVMNIGLWSKGRNREKTIRRSKAVGEP
ncbi:MAG: xanthine dehydrogenase molybdopterin binding subunit, partial [Pseudomonadota bacterium]